MQLGAFYPFSRNHNTIDAQAQEPYLWESVTVASRKALAVRYALLPYYYTLFFQSHKFGATVVRPLFFEFAADEQTVHMDRQFLVGGGLMVTPVLEQRQTSVPVYFAKGVWYDWYTQRVAAVVEGAGQWKTLPAALDHINVHIRGGHIVPTQEPAMTVAESRQNDRELIVALDAAGRATGNLFLDDGDSLPMLEKDQSYIHFDFAPKTSGGFALTATGDFGYTSRAPLDTVYFLGVKEAPTKMTLNGVTVDGSKWSFDVEHQRLIVLDLDVKIRAKFVLAWV